MSIDVRPDSYTQTRSPSSKPKIVPRTLDRPRRSNSTGKLVAFGVAASVLIGVVALALFSNVSVKSPVKALTHEITRGELVVSVTEEGTLESSSNTEIKCKVKGGSTVLWVIESGTQVKPDDELVRLDTSAIEDNINQQKITYQTALATYAQSESNVAVAEISITEYLEGTFRTELKTAQSNVAISEENLRVAQNVLDHGKKMFQKGYVSELELDGNMYSVEHAKLQLELMKTQVNALERFTKAKMLKELESTLKASKAKLASDEAALDLEKARLTRAEQQLQNCVIKAEKAGMVIFPSAAEWKEQPDIEEGAAVREDQVLLIIPDLTNMQVKVGIHESKVDRLKTKMKARIRLQDETVDGEVASVATVTKPAGWWTGNAVKYDTVISLHNQEGLKPGMSAEVEVFLAEHKDVLTIPVAAVVQLEDGFYTWLQIGDEMEKRKLELGDSDDQFIVVHDGVKEGDRVVLNPRAHVDEAQAESWKPIAAGKPKTKKGNKVSQSLKPSQPSTGDSAKGKSEKPNSNLKVTGAAILKMADKNGDGVLTEDEFAEKDKQKFDSTDLNQDGKVDASELDAAVKTATEAAAQKK